MVKKFLSLLGVVSILSTMVVSTAFALDLDTLVQTLVASPSKVTVGGTPMTATATVAETASTTVVAKIQTTATPAVDVVTLTNVTFEACVSASCPVAIVWDGKKADGTYADDGNYKLSVTATDTDADTDTDTIDVSVFTPLTTPTLSLSKSTYDPGDPAQTAVTVTYNVNKATNVTVYVKDGTATTAKTIDTFSTSANKDNNTSTWNGTYDTPSELNGKLVPAGDYYVTVEANDGTSTLTSTAQKVTVSYGYTLAPKITEYVVDPSSLAFDTDDETVTVSFNLDSSAVVTVAVYDAAGTLIYEPTVYESDEKETDEISGDREFEWDGEDSLGCLVSTGKYTVKTTARNANGVATVSTVLDVTSAGSKCISGSTKIRNVSMDPASTWNPIEDKLELEWDIDTEDLSELTIQARKGSQEVELYSESDPEKDEGYSFDWDGIDEDGEYVDTGSWKIVFLGLDESGTTDVTYYVEKTIKVEYDKPSIDDSFVTKSEIDPELDEGVYFAFILEDDANVDVEVLKNSSSKVDLLEDERVDADKWYAVYWDGKDDDGDLFDNDDTFKIRLTAKSLGDEDIYSTVTDSIDLDTDDTSSTKSNVINDVVLPPVVATSDDVVLSFTLKSSAEVTVGVWEGTSTSGSADADLLTATQKSAGKYKYTWNLKDKNGNPASKGYYSYKISAKKAGSTSVEAESGKFYVGTVGEVWGEPSDEPVTPVVPVDDNDDNEEGCGFADVSASNPNCVAIKWGKEQGVVAGNPDGTFDAYSKINRVEAVKMVLLAAKLGLLADDGTNLGWSDVRVGSWYVPYLKTGKAYGMVSGFAGTTLVKPNDDVTRAQILKLAYQAEGGSVGTCSYSPYGDVAVSAWYAPYVCKSATDGLMETYGSDFQPNTAATRGEVMEALYRLFK